MSDLDRRQLLTATAALGVASFDATRVWAQDTSKAAPDLTGQSILITGTSSGFGRLSAEHFARLGATVFASMRNVPREEARELEALAEKDGLDITVVEIDVLSDKQVKRGVQKVLNATGGTLDVLVNNAGIGITGPIELQDMEATQLAFDTNVFGPQRMTRAVLPAMRKQGSGHIVNISSQLGRVILPTAGNYSPTKFALEAASEQYAYELAPQGIGVTIIQPGGYPTDIWKNRNRYNTMLKTRSPKSRLEAYPQAVARMGQEDGSGRSADPMDIPHAIADVLSEPMDQRPLRVAVHPGNKPQVKINEVSAQTQIAMLGGRNPTVKAVNLRGT